MSGNDWWKEQHGLQLREPIFWWIWAQKHFRSAELIWGAYDIARAEFKADPDAYRDVTQPSVDDMDLLTIAFYHLAVALELTVKGHLVRADPQIVEKKVFTRITSKIFARAFKYHFQRVKSIL